AGSPAEHGGGGDRRGPAAGPPGARRLELPARPAGPAARPPVPRAAAAARADRDPQPDRPAQPDPGGGGDLATDVATPALAAVQAGRGRGGEPDRDRCLRPVTAGGRPRHRAFAGGGGAARGGPGGPGVDPGAAPGPLAGAGPAAGAG